MQRALQRSGSSGLHVVIIMDGNGRRALARGLALIAGRRAGAQADPQAAIKEFHARERRFGHLLEAVTALRLVEGV